MNGKDSLYVGVKFKNQMDELAKARGTKQFKEETRRFIEDVYRYMQDNNSLPLFYTCNESRATVLVPPPTYGAPQTTSTVHVDEFSDAPDPHWTLPEGQTYEVEDDDEEEPAPEPEYLDENDYDDESQPWKMPKMPMAPWWPVPMRKKCLKLYNKYGDPEPTNINMIKRYRGKWSSNQLYDMVWAGSKNENPSQLIQVAELPTVFVSEEDRNGMLKDWVEIGYSLWHPEMAEVGRKVCTQGGIA